MKKSELSDTVKKDGFQPKTDFEDYLTNDFNLGIYRDLTEDEDWKGLFEPLEFFNLFYQLIHFVDQHKNKPVTVKKHLSGLKLNQESLYYLSDRLYTYYSTFKDKQLEICNDMIGDIRDQLENELFPEHEESRPEKKEPEFDFNKDLAEANKINDLHERLLFLITGKKEFDQHIAGGWNFYLDDKSKQYQLEIDYVKKLINQQQHKGMTGKANQPIWWQKSGRLLGYLIEELAKKGFIQRDTDINKVIKEHFIDVNKRPFTDSIKQNRSGSGINKNSKPKGFDDIDKILNNLND